MMLPVISEVYTTPVHGIDDCAKAASKPQPTLGDLRGFFTFGLFSFTTFIHLVVCSVCPCLPLSPPPETKTTSSLSLNPWDGRRERMATMKPWKYVGIIFLVVRCDDDVAD